jgi:hypothetical protein
VPDLRVKVLRYEAPLCKMNLKIGLHTGAYYLEIISLNSTLDKTHDYRPLQDEQNSDYRVTEDRRYN